MNNFEEIIKKILNQSILETNNIPNLDLYMDQIMTLFETYLQDNKRNQDDKLLTKTMINNYSKAKIIKPVKGKKYNKEQIIGMLLIYYLKNTITIEEIKLVLSPIYENDEQLEDIYNEFIKIKEQQSADIKQFINNYDLNVENDNNRLITILVLSSLANQFTKMAQGIIDTYYQND